jgi:hypothetical protein
MDRTDRFDLKVEYLKMQPGLAWLGIGSRECENEYQCILDTKQYIVTQISKFVILLEKM